MSEIIKDTDHITIESLSYKNPRIIKTHKDAALGGSMDKWGDLGVFVFNMTSSRWVTAHQRMRKLKEKYGNRVKIYIEKKLAEPDEFGTVGIGYVGVEGTNVRFAYREVLFSEADEYAAGLASNNATGENDNDMLAQIDYELSQFDNGDELLKLTGQSDDEIAKLLNDSGAIELEDEKSKPDDGMKRLPAKFTDDQFSTLYEAIAIMKRNKQLTNEQNTDLDANAIYYICRSYIENNGTSQNIEITPQTPDTSYQAPDPEAPTYSTSYYNTPETTTTADDLTSIPS